MHTGRSQRLCGTAKNTDERERRTVMEKIKNAVKTKEYAKFHMETIVAHNGILVDIVVSESYEETEFDKIMADCKRQEEERERERRRTEKIKLINLFTGKRVRREIA